MDDGAASEQHPQPETIGPYRVVGILGSGGMGVVYRAVDPVDGETVAVKTVPGLKTEWVQGMRAEIIALTRIHHPGLVRIIRHGIDSGLPWYAMELLPGQNLAAYNDALWAGRGVRSAHTTEYPTTGVAPDAGAVSPPSLVRQPLPTFLRSSLRPPAANGRLLEVLTLYRRLCLALAHLHQKGFVHRDVKPPNVMVRPEGQPVLLDFGLAARPFDSVGRVSIETIGRLIGTLSYLAPEQIRREFVDARADLYSFGCMLYESVTGVQPFRGGSGPEICRQHLETPPLRPSELVDDLPPELENLILRLLAKLRRDRIGHAEEVAAALVGLGAADEPAEVHSRGALRLYRPELAGRDPIVRDLDGALDRLAGGGGGCILLGGQSGVGKTFLISEIARRAGVRRLRVVGGECVAAGVATTAALDIRSSPLHPLWNLFQAVADSCRQGGEGTTERLLGSRGKVLQPYAPFFDTLAGQGLHPEPPELASPENLRRLLDALRDTLFAYAQAGSPLLLLLDDLQWADEVTLKFLGSLSGDRLLHLPLLILGTYRAEEVQGTLQELIQAPHVTRIAITRLEARYVGRVIADMLGVSDVPEPFVQYVALHSEGNPFFVAEYVRAAVEDKLIYRELGSWRFAGATTAEGLGRLPVPRPIHELVGRRLAGLSGEARNLLEHAAVLRRDIDQPLLASLVHVDEPTVIALLNELLAKQILETTESGRYRFGHDQLREITYRAIAVDRRRAMHRAAAEALEPALFLPGRNPPYATLAHHFAEAEMWAKATDYFEKAAQEALANFSNREAISYFESALTFSKNLVGGVGPLRLAHWERGLVEAHLGLGEYPAGRLHAEQALRLCGMPLPRTSAGFVLGLVVHAARHAMQSLARPLFRVRAPRRIDLLLEGSYVLNRLFEPLLFANLPLQATYCGLRNLNVAQRLPPSIPFARGYASMCIVAGMVAPLARVARGWADRSLELARDLRDDESLIYALSRSSCFFITVAEWDECGVRLKEGREVAARIGDRRGFDEILAIECQRLFYSGQLAASLGLGADLSDSGSQRGDNQTTKWGENLRLQALARLGRYEEALRLVPRLSKWAESATDLDRAYQYGNFALLFARVGDLGRARKYADLSLQCLGPGRPAAYFLLNGIWGAGEGYLAVARAAGKNAWSERPDLRGPLLRIQTALKQLAQLMRFGRPAALLWEGLLLSLRGQDRKAVRTLTKALHAAQELHMPYEEARAQVELARRLPGDESGPHFVEANRLLRQVGTAYDAARVDEVVGASSTVG